MDASSRAGKRRQSQPEELASPAVAKPVAKKRISLALQGGGTHGAFTWGAMERLLEDERIDFDGFSGTSAGAINGAMVVEGLIEGGPAGAITALDRFWRSMAANMAVSPLQALPWEKAMWGHDLTWSIAYRTFDTLSRVLSPYQINPFPINYNPLRDALNQSIDFERLREETKAPRLFVSATNVRTGKPRVFTRREIDAEVLLASACLPQVFKAVEIEGEPYWDGGYLGNPALWPLYEQGGPPDIMLIQLNPQAREETPTSASDIVNRLNEITFNGSLMAEMRAIDFVQRLLDAGRLEQPRYRRLFIHLIEDEDRLRSFKLSTKFNGDWEFLCMLRQFGREAAEKWLTEHFDKLGRESSVDIRERFL